MPLLIVKFLNLFLSVFIMGAGFFGLLITQPVQAQKYDSKIPDYTAPSVNIMGMTGLNVIPTSRMDKVGAIRFGVGTTDPYLHAFLGFQVAAPLYINLRQTYEISSLNDSAKRLYPGLDFKLRMIKETEKRPELSIGANSAFGHKRIASEYIVFSKRKSNFDFTGGMAWGRLAGDGHIKNPLRAVSSHFERDRDFNDEDSQSIDDWLTGEDVGFFGGVEYFTPLKGLSLKADYAAYNYDPESVMNSGFNQAEPWSLGLNYKPFNYQPVDLSVGVIGGEKVFARLSLQGHVQKWPGRKGRKIELPHLVYPRAHKEDKDIQDNLTVNLNSSYSTGQQVGHAARYLANNSLPDSENIQLTLNHKGLKGPALTLIRRDLEEAVLNNHGSAEEIWHDVSFSPNKTPFFTFKEYFKNKTYKKFKTRYILENKVSLSEEESGILYRSSIIAELEKQLPLGFKLGYAPRINLADNIGSIRNLRPVVSNPVRSNEGEFSSNRFAIDQLYVSWLHSVNQNVHVKLSAGYLEEMFGGFGGEILYRPFGKTFAVGVEGWRVKKRDGNAPLALETNQDESFTGHVNLFYELPNKNTTMFAKAGQYLGEDVGATIGIQNKFKNGTKLEGFITATNRRDRDIFNATKHLYGGMKLTLPLGNIPYVPAGSEARFTTAPFARDAGQTLNAPDALYEVTEPISYRHLSQSWPDLLH